IQVERGSPVDEHDRRAGGTLELAPVGVTAARPGDGRAVRVGGVRRGEEVDERLVARRLRRVADGPEAIQRAGEGELRGTEAGHEVAAPDAPGLLEGTEHRVDGGEAA